MYKYKENMGMKDFCFCFCFFLKVIKCKTSLVYKSPKKSCKQTGRIPMQYNELI